MLIFDLDGTIIDSEYYHLLAYNEVLKEFNIIINDEEFSSYIGQSEIAIHDLIQKKYNVSYDAEKVLKNRLEVFKRIIKQSHPRIPTRINDLIHLKDEYKCIVSSQEESIIFYVLDILGIRDCFNEIISCHKGAEKNEVLSNPHKYINCDDKNITLCEDAVHALKLGKEKGYKTVGVVHRINKNLGIEKYSDEVVDINS